MRVRALAGHTDTTAPLTDDDISDQGIAEEIVPGTSLPADYLSKRLSPNFGNKQKRRKRLVRNLKRRRSYAKPVRGGTGKQSRTRRNRFK